MQKQNQEIGREKGKNIKKTKDGSPSFFVIIFSFSVFYLPFIRYCDIINIERRIKMKKNRIYYILTGKSPVTVFRHKKKALEKFQPGDRIQKVKGTAEAEKLAASLRRNQKVVEQGALHNFINSLKSEDVPKYKCSEKSLSRHYLIVYKEEKVLIKGLNIVEYTKRHFSKEIVFSLIKNPAKENLFEEGSFSAVSYTHLTLPTKRIV